MLEQYQSETLQIRHEMSLGKQREKEIERWFQNVRKTQANNNIEITKAKMGKVS